VILAYHRINPWYRKDALTVSPENFEKQIKYLFKKRYKFVSLKNYVSNYSLSTIYYPLSLTFDDGFADNFWFALPILEKYKIPATIFLTANFIDTEKTFSRYKDLEKDRFLKWEEIKNMKEKGIDFGSHSLSHPHLTQVSKDKAWEEISISKKVIEDKIEEEISYFCYPYGDYNEEIVSMVEKAGYKGAVLTTKYQVLSTNYIFKNNFTLKRIGIYGHNNFFIYRIKIWRNFLKEKR